MMSLTQVSEPCPQLPSPYYGSSRPNPLIMTPLLDGPVELSAFSFQLILTSLDLVTGLLHLGSCIAGSVASLLAHPKLCSAAQSWTRQNSIPHCIFSSVSIFGAPYQSTCIPLNVLLPLFLHSPTENKDSERK